MLSKREQAIGYIETPGDVHGGNLCVYALAAWRKGKLGVFELPSCTDDAFFGRVAESIDTMRRQQQEGCVLIAGDDVLSGDIATAKGVLRQLALGVASHAVSLQDSRKHRRLLKRAATGALLLGDIASSSPFKPAFDPTFDDEKFYGTAQSNHYETMHPRYFPAVAVALVSDVVTQRILAVAGAGANRVKERAFARREGVRYPTANFFVD
jgi:hypothetical protein